MLKECKVLLGLTLTVFLLFLTGCGDMFDFSTETPATPATPDTTPPTVRSTSPSSGAVNTAITATFSETMAASTITTATFTVGGVTGTVIYTNTTATATFTPSSSLSYSTTYTATITTGVKDAAGNAMASNYTWSFTTASPLFTCNPVEPWSHNYDIGQYNSIAIAPADGRKYITYVDSTANILKISSTSDGTSWDAPTTIGTSPLGHSSMAIDSAGNRHVVYLQQGSPNNVIYTSSIDWKPIILATTTGTDIYADIAIDGSDKAHVSFYDSENTALRYTTNATVTGSWMVTPDIVDTGDAADNPGKYSSIKVDGNKTVHISYADYHSQQSNYNLKYAKKGSSETKWTGASGGAPDYLGSTGDVGKYSSITSDSNNLYITYNDLSNKSIKLISKALNALNWPLELPTTLVNGLSGETTCPLVIDGDGIMHMSYISGGVLYYVSKSWSWSTPTLVDSGIGNGIYTSIAVDSNGKAHISYRDETDFDLKYAHQIN